ncbi:MAG: DMT family transporter [Pseudomonadota bacterium]
MQAERSSLDWLLFAILSCLWASAFALTRIAVNQDAPEHGLPPELVTPLRITGGAVILLIVAFKSASKWPDWRKWRLWLAMALMGLVGTTAPFYLITQAQRTVDSSLAALYVAAAPLFVAILAHMAFHDDRLSGRKIIGLLVGFAGVAVLFGPEAATAFGSADVTAQALCLAATACYACSSIVARLAREIPPPIFAAGFVTSGAILSWPMLAGVDFETLQPAPSTWIAVAALAIGPTAVASTLYMVVIQRTSATFLSLTGYAIPILSAIIGFFAFREMQDWNAALAFLLILGGVWLSQRAGGPPAAVEPISSAARPQSPSHSGPAA